MFKNIKIIYFSGTGGTKRVADVFEEKIRNRGFNVSSYALDMSPKGKANMEPAEILGNSELVILIYAVHAVDAPDPVYWWIEKAEGKGKKAAVFSVSGGGEGWPNYGCRSICIAEMEKRGFDVIYEKMLIMPCNWVFTNSDDLALRLLQILPLKVDKILHTLLVGGRRRTNDKKDPFTRWLTKAEKKGARKFVRSIKINEKCTGCGWCSGNCPVCNISMKDGKPIFDEKCIMCFRCVYGCPGKAMESNNFMVLKKGFDIQAVEKRMEGKEPAPVEKCAKGILYKKVRAYLMDKDE